MIGRPEDYEAIRQCAARFHFGWDTKNFDIVRGVFTEDFIFDTSNVGMAVVRNLDELEQIFHWVHARAEHVYHITGNHVIDFVDEDHANGWLWVLGEMLTSDRGHIVTKVYYEDEFVRVDGQWKLRSRKGHTCIPRVGAPPSVEVVRA